MLPVKSAKRILHCGFYCSFRLFYSKPKEITAIAVLPENVPVRQRLFTGVQPTGPLHLGNYLGVVKKWVELQHTKEDAFLCISDLHSLTTSSDPPKLRENIFCIAASLLACGVNPQHTTLFVQSAVKEHSELYWILGSMSSMANLGHQPMYVEKTRLSQQMQLGVFTYPVLQAADILLYKSTHVPIGEDQISHIGFAKSLAESFNSRYDQMFPIFEPIIAEYNNSRVRCLKDPSKKMSKSNENPMSAIYIHDEPDIIASKIKEATTDFASDVRYEPEKRVGLSNLIGIHASIAGKTPEDIVTEVESMDTMKYKTLLTEALVENLSPIRRKYQDLVDRRDELIFKLDAGAVKAHAAAAETLEEVKQWMGLGALRADARSINDINKKFPTTNSNRQTQAYTPFPDVSCQQIREEKAFQYEMPALRKRY